MQPAKALSGKLVASIAAPAAARKTHSVQHHGLTLEDSWHWLRDPAYPKVESPEILDYLNAENAYFNHVMNPHQALVDEIFTELRGRHLEEDAGVPFRDGDWLYQWRIAAGTQRRTWWRCGYHKDQQDKPWHCLLDEEALAQGTTSFTLGDWCCSPNGRYLAWSFDAQGAERFTIHIRDLETNLLLDAAITDTLGSLVWTTDSKNLLYTVLNEQWRPYQVKAHRLGESVNQDSLLYEEKSDAFWVSIGLTQSRAWVVLGTGDHETSEMHLLPAADPFQPTRLVSPRRTGHRYDLDHAAGHFWIRTNDQHKNFRLVATPEKTLNECYWREEIAPSDDCQILGLTAFQNFYVVEERAAGLGRIRIRTYEGDEHYIALPEPIYEVALHNNAQFDADKVRIHYSSPVTPATVFDYSVTGRRLDTLKVQAIPGGYNKSLYRCERLYAEARDSAQVPVSLVYRHDLVKNGSAPLYLYGYGAYGHVLAPGFSSAGLSLLERGYVCAIAHTRGGADMGEAWYEAGKLQRRTNTFNDFTDVARCLIDAGYTSAGRIAIAGGSAGGELMGAVSNQAPELWSLVIAHVPFVDVLNTMLDETLPLTPMEWPEWGNPITDKAAFELIQSYSPYDQVSAQGYPPMLVTAGLHDPRVGYWEAAKWVARLRHLKTDENVLLLKVEMGAGHQGKSGRYDRLQEQAEIWAFILLATGSHSPAKTNP